jgi:hypothetical protein
MCAKNVTSAQGKIYLYVIVLRKDNELCFSLIWKSFSLYLNLHSGNGKTIYIGYNYWVGLASGKVPDARRGLRIRIHYIRIQIQHFQKVLQCQVLQKNTVFK